AAFDTGMQCIEIAAQLVALLRRQCAIAPETCCTLLDAAFAARQFIRFILRDQPIRDALFDARMDILLLLIDAVAADILGACEEGRRCQYGSRQRKPCRCTAAPKF